MPNCSSCNSDFEIKDNDKSFYETMSVPEPTSCPECRMRHRMTFRNEQNLYKRICDSTKKPIISIYHEKSPHIVYSANEWWSDKWDGINYGMNYDPAKPFFDQFKELLLKVPRIALFNVNPENSDYCQQAYDNKNCYLCTVIKECEDCMYISHTNNAVDSYDCDFTQNVQLSYSCLDSDKLYACKYCQNCQNSNDLIFCNDCIGCQSCYGSYGLRNKKFYIYNKKYSEVDYKAIIAQYNFGKYSNVMRLQDEVRGYFNQKANRANWNINTIDSLGNYLINAKNCDQCFDSFEIQDCSYCTWIFESHDIHDVYGMGTSEWVYNSVGVENLNKAAFNTFVSDSNDVYYSDCCFYSADLFGCAGLRNKKNCILNKQYTPEEYESLKNTIIQELKSKGQWGEFFPASLSPFGYDESVAQEHFPLNHEKTEQLGFKWSGYEEKISGSDKIIEASDLPDDIKDVNDDILNTPIRCGESKKLFKIQKNELTFLRDHSIPLPRFHNTVRYQMRMGLRNPKKLWVSKCTKCQAPIKTTHDPAKAEQVLCSKCYQDVLD